MIIATLAFLASAFQPFGDTVATGKSAPDAAPTTTRPGGAPAPGATLRVLGDASVKPVLENGEYRLPELGMMIEAPLSEGYPAPTPPGMIELKTYPSVRRAEYSAKGSSNFGMNVGFWPLFNHIKSREIAMTSPVEMDYKPAGERTPLAPMQDAEGSWTMSFLYRKADLGPTGEDGRIKVVDTPEMTVLSIGMRGAYGMGTVNSGMDALSKWLAAQSQWEAIGDPRGLNYNGPQVSMKNKWSEVQIVVRRRSATASPATGGAPSAPSAVTPVTPAAPAAPSPAPIAPATPVNPPATAAQPHP